MPVAEAAGTVKSLFPSWESSACREFSEAVVQFAHAAVRFGNVKTVSDLAGRMNGEVLALSEEAVGAAGRL